MLAASPPPLWSCHHAHASTSTSLCQEPESETRGANSSSKRERETYSQCREERFPDHELCVRHGRELVHLRRRDAVDPCFHERVEREAKVLATEPRRVVALLESICDAVHKFHAVVIQTTRATDTQSSVAILTAVERPSRWLRVCTSDTAVVARRPSLKRGRSRRRQGLLCVRPCSSYRRERRRRE